MDHKRTRALIEEHYQHLLNEQIKLDAKVEEDKQTVDRLLRELGVEPDMESAAGYFDSNGTYVIMGDSEPKKTKGRKQDGGMARYKERKWPVADNGLPVLEPGLYWLVDKVNASVNVSSGYNTEMQTMEVSRLCLMNSHKKEHYGFLMMQTRDKREASVRLLSGSKPMPLTPSNLLEQADWLMDKMEEKRIAAADKAKQDELLGDYRHKALEIER